MKEHTKKTGSKFKNFLNVKRYQIFVQLKASELSKTILWKVNNCQEIFGRVLTIMYQPTDAASLGVVRFLFGLCMVLDVVEERGFADVDIKWGDPRKCYFPLIHGMKPLSLPWMIVLYTVLWAGAFGIMLGFYFKVACAFFIFPYWYLFILDKSYWNNHTYLYGIVSLLFSVSGANKYFSLDAILAKDKMEIVPAWNYFALKFQFFALYFLAGLKKGCREWLEGYAMTNLSNHWVFTPYKLFLTVEQTDLLVVHWFGFVFDLTVGFWMIFSKTRFPAMIFSVAFHFMNSRLFTIGMFPYVCLATMFLFCEPNWPRKLNLWRRSILIFFKNKKPIKSCETNHTKNNTKLVNQVEKSRKSLPERNAKREVGIIGRRLVFIILIFHVFLQLFLPYSHFITKGYNNWVPGLYGYSWDMMVHAWDTILVVVKVHDNDNDVDYYINPETWNQNDRWFKHGDMLKQYAHCLETNLQREMETLDRRKSRGLSHLSKNISIYIDVWCSLNGRFHQRMFHPTVDLLRAQWNVFQPVSYLIPLLSNLSHYRNKLTEIQKRVYSWSNDFEVLFIADFPNMYLENYIHGGLSNVTLTVLEGSVIFIEEGQEENRLLAKGSSTNVKTDTFHQIHVTSDYPACYMYTYNGSTKNLRKSTEEKQSTHPLLKEMSYKIHGWTRVFSRIVDAFFYFAYNIPIAPRVKISRKE